MKTKAKTLEGVHTHTHKYFYRTKNKIKVTSASTVSVINNIKNKELYIEKNYI